MAGNKQGGLKARNTNLKKYGPNFYKEIGAKGGRSGHTGGFAADRERARIAGAKGGRISRRGPAKHKTTLAERRRAEARREGTEEVGVWKRLRNFIN